MVVSKSGRGYRSTSNFSLDELFTVSGLPALQNAAPTTRLYPRAVHKRRKTDASKVEEQLEQTGNQQISSINRENPKIMDVQTQMNHSQDLADMHESIIKLLKQFKYVSNKMEKLLKKITAASQAAHPRSDDVLKAQRKLVAQCLQSATEAMSMEARTLIDGLEEAVEASTDMKE